LNNFLAKPIEKLPKIIEKVSRFIADRPTELDFPEVIDKATGRVCKSCANCTKCWVKNYNATHSALFSIEPTLTEFGAILEEDFPTYFASKCLKLNALKNQINHLGVKKNLIEEKQDITHSRRDNVLYLYKFMPEIENKLQLEFEDRGISVSSVIAVENAYGNLEISLNVRTKHPIEEIVALCQAATGRKMRVSDLTPNEEGRIHARIVQRPSVEIEVGIAKEGKKGESESGDTYSFSKISENKVVITLSDGCGHGRIAAKYSETTATLMKRFLSAGIPKNKAIELVSSVLLLGNNDEKFATADIAIFDVFSGNLELIKLGANASYIIRRNEGQLERISSSSLPIGVFKQTDIDRFVTNLSNGDYCVMLSDGIESPNNLWIKEFLNNPALKNVSAQNLAELIIEEARIKERVEDDRLVIVGKIARI